MLKYRIISWGDFEKHTSDLYTRVKVFRPDYIVGMNRGGLPPAVLLSHKFDIPHWPLTVRLRHGAPQVESTTWMVKDILAGKKLLIVDDICDSGATIKWIINSWQEYLKGSGEGEKWQEVAVHNVRIASLFVKEQTRHLVDAYCEVCPDDVWVVFPWETLPTE